MITIAGQDPASARGPMTAVLQRTGSDCGVASLAALLRIPYETAEAAILEVTGRTGPVDGRGLNLWHLQEAGRRLGHTLWREPQGDPHAGDSIGSFRWTWPNGSPNWHFAPIRQGVVLETTGVAYPLDVYLARHRDARLCSILVDAEAPGYRRAAVAEISALLDELAA